MAAVSANANNTSDAIYVNSPKYITCITLKHFERNFTPITAPIPRQKKRSEQNKPISNGDQHRGLSKRNNIVTVYEPK